MAVETVKDGEDWPLTYMQRMQGAVGEVTLRPFSVELRERWLAPVWRCCLVFVTFEKLDHISSQ